MTTWIRVCVAITLLVACGHKNGGAGDPDAPGPGSGSDAGIDAPPFSGACTPGGTSQCSNCIDDDHDGKIDGFDPECTGPLDNDEATFATGIPGDNKDPVHQDCFFDGDSGAGNDGCNIHVCCLLGATGGSDCPYDKNFDPAQDCGPVSQECIDKCGKAAPPGCDCFGCCTICDGANCYTVDINPAVSPNCTPDKLSDPTVCKTCTKNTQCTSAPCSADPGSDSCTLCPGQDPSTLPPSCTGSNTCPSGQTSCLNDGACSTGTYCSAGCCVGVIL